MINTFQTSIAPPPVPPRLGRSQPFLIPAPLPSSDSNKHLIRFLVCVVTLLLFIAVGGFLFIYYNNNNNNKEAEKGPSAQAIVGHHPSEKRETSSRALARMIADSGQKSNTKNESSGYLKWQKDHSILKKINFYKEHWVTILEPGDYHVFSRVTFSKGSLRKPLAGRIKLRQSHSEEEEIKMKAYCSLNYSASNPQMCTITMEDLLTLKRGNQLSVWVQDLSLVDYEEGATTFGMFQL